MFTTAETDSSAIKSQNLELLRDHHQSLLDNLGVDRKQLQGKSVFYDSKRNQVIGVYKREFLNALNGGMYFELTDNLNNPIDPQRTVYKCPVNAEFETEYEPSPRWKESYLVPVDELRIVNPTSVAISGTSAIIDIITPQKEKVAKPITKKEEPQDAPFAEMSIRDLYAVLHNKPVSKKEWLNNLINSK